MAAFEVESLPLARRAIDALDIDLSRITHLVVATCTGFAAPGLDVRIALALGLRADVQRTLVGFMGCAAAVPALRIAAAAVVADQAARVLVVNLEICSLHLQESDDLTTVLSYLLWGDGCAASLVSADAEGLALGDFRAAIIPDSAGLITWKIGDSGFLMHLSGQVPMRIAQTLLQERRRNEPAGLLRGEGAQAVDLWAVHAGGRTVLDAVEAGLGLGPAALDASRAVLDEHGNMSSATVMFVLRRLLREAKAGARGLAMAFGPGMVAETFRFRAA